MSNHFLNRINIILIISILLLTSCEKTESSIDECLIISETCGNFQGIVNEEFYQGEILEFRLLEEDSTISFTINNCNFECGTPIDYIRINNIPFKEGKYYLIDRQNNPDEPNISFNIFRGGDVQIAKYLINEQENNFLKILNTKNNELQAILEANLSFDPELFEYVSLEVDSLIKLEPGLINYQIK